jgi:hypothetical protein
MLLLSTLTDLVPVRVLSTRPDHRADAARFEQGRRAAGVAARERRVAPLGRAGALYARDRAWLAALSRLPPGGRWAAIFSVASATILAWHRRLASRTWDYTAHRRPGRPPTAAAIKSVVIRMAAENPTWGHRRVPGELVRLGHRIAFSTVWQISA